MSATNGPKSEIMCQTNRWEDTVYQVKYKEDRGSSCDNIFSFVNLPTSSVRRRNILSFAVCLTSSVNNLTKWELAGCLTVFFGPVLLTKEKNENGIVMMRMTVTSSPRVGTSKYLLTHCRQIAPQFSSKLFISSSENRGTIRIERQRERKMVAAHGLFVILVLNIPISLSFSCLGETGPLYCTLCPVSFHRFLRYGVVSFFGTFVA